MYFFCCFKCLWVYFVHEVGFCADIVVSFILNKAYICIVSWLCGKREVTSSHRQNIIQTTSIRTKDITLTRQLKAWEEALEEVLAWIWHGNCAEFRHYNAVMLKVRCVAITVEEAAHVCHLSILYVELVQKRHPIKPMVETKEQIQLIYFPVMIVICSVLKEPKCYSPASSDLKLSRSIPEEIAFDPWGNVTCNCGCDGLWGFIYRTNQILNAWQTMNIGEVLIFILWPGLLPACWEKKNFRYEVLCTTYFRLERNLNLPVLLLRRFIEDMLVCLLSWKCFKSCLWETPLSSSAAWTYKEIL